MKRSGTFMLLTLSFASLPADAESESFANFLLGSPSIISPSQIYQVNGGRFEAGTALIQGRQASRVVDSSAAVSGHLVGAGYTQGLSPEVVLAVDISYFTVQQEIISLAFENSAREVRPTLAFGLTPLFHLGARAHIVSGESLSVNDSKSYDATLFTLGGTLHEDLWETSLAVTTKNQNEDHAEASTPQILALHGRYRVMPVVTLGLALDQADYPGIETGEELLQTEFSSRLIVESTLNEKAKVEAALTLTQHFEGEDGTDTREIFLGGAYKITGSIDFGGRIVLVTTEAVNYQGSLNTFALTLAYQP